MKNALFIPSHRRSKTKSQRNAELVSEVLGDVHFSQTDIYSCILESDDEYLVKTEMPDMDLRDIEVFIESGLLIVTANAEIVCHHPSNHRRTFSIPPGVDLGSVKAAFHAGVLTIRLPKNHAAKNGRIKVQIN